ncbi:MAG: serine/threonine protein kinase [Aphanothece sp. CMT-3BRIN-NPC111]|jgi:serine/threonine-protein kinase|nr:serine/threonine protein kinase [Aphanothece sp. CMT-3BRIN-NPC111]
MLGTTLAGRYTIISYLGGGGFAQTYLAEDKQLPVHRCIVKKFKPRATDSATWQAARRSFDSEAQTLYHLGKHERIRRLLAHFEENQAFYLVQEWIEGHDLSIELTPGKRLSESYAIALLQNILQPLAFAHQQNVIHRDLKPSNLIRRKQDGKIILTNFGAVKQIFTPTMDSPGQAVAIDILNYLPREQAKGNPRFSSDIYALGMIGIQSLTGLMPHQLQKDPQTSEIIWRNGLQVSPGLADILDTMVRYNFQQRYLSATEALQAVQQLSNPYTPVPQATIPAPPPTPPFSPPPVPQATIPASPPTPPSSPPPVPQQYRQEIPSQPESLQSSSVPTQTGRVLGGWGFLFQWTGATTLGTILGYVLGWLLSLIASLIAVDAVTYAIFGAVFGAAVGIMQWLILRQQIYGAAWWILATTIGAAVSFPVGDVVYNALFGSIGAAVTYAIFGAVFGAAVGITQGLVLRRVGWWVLATTLGAAVSFAFAANLPRVGLVVGGVIFGGITGVVLDWLLSHPVSEN